MTPKGTPDPEYPTSSSRKGERKDKKNLIDVWLKAKPVRLLIYFIVTFFTKDKTGLAGFYKRFVYPPACVSEQEVTLCLAQEGIR